MRTILYYFFKGFVSCGLFFYSKKIKVKGVENIPRKGAVLFMANHPNGLLDPLIIATKIPRKTHFLVRAAVFKNFIAVPFFNGLGMMPIYRIRDGVKQLTKNEPIFEKCKTLLQNQKAILIFPEGSHNRKRTIRPLSKGFTRILFRALDANSKLEINIVPVGITYQNASKYPSKVALYFGKPILAQKFYPTEDPNTSIKMLKQLVTEQLQELSVHISDTTMYAEKLKKLNRSQVDFTDIETVNWIVEKNNYPPKKQPKKELKLLKFILIVNSWLPYFIWKRVALKIERIEFMDTFRFALSSVLFPVFYALQGVVISYFFGNKIGWLYFSTSLLLVLLYTKLSPTNTEYSKQV